MDQTMEYIGMVSDQIELLDEYNAKFALAIVARVCPDAFRYALDFLD